jgi:hypothetical protein
MRSLANSPVQEIAMRFRIQGLDPAPYLPLFELDAAVLAERGIVRERVDDCPGAPCRITLDEIPAGMDALLLSHAHQPAATPYQQAGPIYVSRAAKAWDAINAAPPALARRMLSLRGYDAAGMMIAAALTPGAELAGQVEAIFADAKVATIHAHYALRGCFAAAITRA